MVKIKERDFVELEFVGKIKDTDTVFDLTNEDDAKKYNLFSKDFKYGPRVICVGEKEILPGIDKALINQEVPSKITITLSPADAYGSRDSKLIKTIPTDILLKQNIKPFPGLQITASGLVGTIRTVTYGRTMVDFNHPLAGKELSYEITLKSIVTDDKIKLTNLFENSFRITNKDYEITYENNNAKITLKEIKLPADIKKSFEKKAKELIPNLNITLN